MSFWAIKTRSSKSRKIDILAKGLTRGFRRKMAIFPNFFWFNTHDENVFYDILERKNAFLGCKNKKNKKRKIDILPKGLTHDFGPKMAISPSFFLGNIGQEKVFYDILERKNPFLRYKNKKFKSRKIAFFEKGLTNGFGPKNGHFSNFFF